MKVLCPQCDRLGELEQYRVDQGTLIVTCTKCGAATRVETAPASSQPASTPPPGQTRLHSSPTASNVVRLKNPATDAVEQAALAATTNAFAVPAGLCPKCFTRRSETSRSCVQCGLNFETFDPQSFETPAWLAEEWLRLLTRWGDEARHAAVREKARAAEALVDIGRLYRLRLALVPDDPYALHGREEVVRLASVPVSTRSSAMVDQPDHARGKLVALVGALLIVFVAAGFVLRLVLMSRGEP